MLVKRTGQQALVLPLTWAQTQDNFLIYFKQDQCQVVRGGSSAPAYDRRRQALPPVSGRDQASIQPTERCINQQMPSAGRPQPQAAQPYRQDQVGGKVCHGTNSPRFRV